MNVLIIGGSRVGGTKICEWLGYELSIEYIHEPFAHWRDDVSKDINQKRILRDRVDGMIVKIFPGLEWELLKGMKWDCIIGLSRENLRETAESMVWAEVGGEWHSDYRIPEEWVKGNEKLIREGIQRAEEWRNRILNNDKVNLQITYEGIYHTKGDRDKLKALLGIQQWRFDTMLNTEYRYRKNGETQPQIKKNII